MKRAINTDKAPSPVGPYSQSIRTGDFLFVSGQIALDAATGKMHNSDVGEETHMIMKNLEAILEAAGMDFENVVKCSIFVRDIRQYARINEIYAGYFTGPHPPARELVEVSNLPKDASVEISLIATTNS